MLDEDELRRDFKNNYKEDKLEGRHLHRKKYEELIKTELKGKNFKEPEIVKRKVISE